MFTVIETFTASWTNNIAGLISHEYKTFKKGEIYTIQYRRPEGIFIHGFFLFSHYFVHIRFED